MLSGFLSQVVAGVAAARSLEEKQVRRLKLPGSSANPKP